MLYGLKCNKKERGSSCILRQNEELCFDVETCFRSSSSRQRKFWLWSSHHLLKTSTVLSEELDLLLSQNETPSHGSSSVNALNKFVFKSWVPQFVYLGFDLFQEFCSSVRKIPRYEWKNETKFGRPMSVLFSSSKVTFHSSRSSKKATLTCYDETMSAVRFKWLTPFRMIRLSSSSAWEVSMSPSYFS